MNWLYFYNYCLAKANDKNMKYQQNYECFDSQIFLTETLCVAEMAEIVAG